ncbi:hypothetical protein, partial [Methanoculleus sp. UBA208]
KRVSTEPIFHYQGKKTAIHTKVSHGNKEISDTLINLMAKQIYLSKSQFEGLVECTVKEDDLVKIYSESGML